VKVIIMSVQSDWILLESVVDLCEKEPPIGGTADGRKYIQLGLSARSLNESYVSVSNGVFCSSRINNLGHILGSAGANPGDSGGPCIDEISGDLIGMNVGSKNIHISGSGTVSEAYDKASSKFASRAHIIPVIGLKFLSP
jgi:S1-C subfamily serine protease